MQDARAQLSGLGKCALFSSFIFAVGIWLVVAESDASAYSTPVKPDVPRYAKVAAGVAQTGGDRLRGTSPDARRALRTRNGTRNSGAGRRGAAASAERERELDLKTQEIREAQKDPNSMFDMSNP